MEDAGKTNGQLIEELAELRQRILELEAAEARHKNIEEALEKSEEKYHSLYSAMNEGVCLHEIIYNESGKAVDYRILDVNPSYERILGLSREEAIGSIASEFYGSGDPPYIDIYARVAESGQPISFETYFPPMDKHFSISVFSPREGQFATIFSDVTERKRTEDMLITERERLAVTLRSIGDGVIATDADGRVVLVNEVAEGFTGWAEEEAVGKSLSEIFHIINEDTRERCENLVEKILQTDGIIGLANSTILVSKDGIERLIADSGSPIRDRDGSIIGVVLVFRDVTERRRIEQGIMRVQKLESIAILAGGIAHDFNNLLTGILGNISLARMYTDPDKVSERLLEAERASLKGEELTRQLLTFSRGGTSFKKTSSIAEILKDSAILKLKGSNIRSEFSIPDNLWQGEVDPEQISQVINSIVINARQAMPQGGKIRIQAGNVIVEAGDALPLKGGEYVRILIQDQGIGIPKEHLGSIFDPYFTTKQKGSGLGLAASYFIIRNHGGYIAAESQVGVGTTFYIYLPASPGEVPIEVPIESKEAEDKLIADEGRILIMDDDELIRELASDMLTGIGYKVTVAKDGAEAIRRYKNAKESGNPFDLVIIDLIARDGMEGEETIRNLIEIDPEVKAIASSGYSNDPVLVKFREYGFSGAISKPYKVKELSKVLRKIKEQ